MGGGNKNVKRTRMKADYGVMGIPNKKSKNMMDVHAGMVDIKTVTEYDVQDDLAAPNLVLAGTKPVWSVHVQDKLGVGSIGMAECDQITDIMSKN